MRTAQYTPALVSVSVIVEHVFSFKMTQHIWHVHAWEDFMSHVYNISLATLLLVIYCKWQKFMAICMAMDIIVIVQSIYFRKLH